MSTDNDKLALFDEFFSIETSFNVNAKVVPSQSLPDYEQFLQRMPMPFKMSSEIHSLDQSALRPLQAVAGVANQLMDYLNHQAQKMDLLVGYILAQQDIEQERYQAVKFGGGGVIFKTATDDPLKVDDFIELKLFFAQENNAIYCIAEIIATEMTADSHLHKVIFHHIRDEDRELLVRNSLHQQSRQLQALAQERKRKQEQE